MGDANVAGRIIMQQCVSAKLQTNAECDETPHFVSIGSGIVIYVCFMKNATEDTALKMARTVCNIRLSPSGNSGRVSVTDLPGDILVVPQATLGGKQKGNRMQYHGNIDKTDGKKLYETLIENLKKIQSDNSQCLENDVHTQFGTYGNLQVLSVDTNGPYTHVLNF